MVEDSGDTITIILHLRRVDGKIVPYRLWVDATKPLVKVREARPEHLPDWCPELHINNAGFFCLGYGADAPALVVDAVSADKWWSILISFLKLQERAKGLRRWPNGNVWAHGGAAKFQAAAEQLAAGLDAASIWTALRTGHLKVKKHKGRFLRVMAGAERLYSVWDKAADGKLRIVNVRRPCLCGSNRSMHKCADHADLAVMLALALLNMKSAETDFWTYWMSRKCCGRVETCPLLKKDAVAIAA